MAKQDQNKNQDPMQALRDQRAQAERDGDTARVAEIDRQLAQGQTQSGNAQPNR